MHNQEDILDNNDIFLIKIEHSTQDKHYRVMYRQHVYSILEP